MKINRSVTALLAGSAALSLVLAGCSTDGNDTATKSETSAASSAAASSEAAASESVTYSDGYIKEKPAEKMMTGIFGVLKNNTDKDIKIVDFMVKDIDEGTVFEQHDTKDGKMFKLEGGHTIPAGGELKFVPGGKHLMIMHNKQAMEQGQEFTLVINFDDGSSVTKSIPVRVQAAGEEDYAGDGQLSNPEHQGHNM